MNKITERLEKELDKQVEKNFNEESKFLAELLRAKSRNPGMGVGGSVEVETQMAKLIKGKLREMGVMSRYLRARRGRPNIVSVVGPMRTRKSLMLIGHMDTAMKHKEEPVLSVPGLVRSGKMFGEGVLDMKASLAIYLFALQAILNLGWELDGKLKLVFVADGKGEKPSKWGLAYLLNKGLSAKAAILGKPGTDKIAIGHRGGYRFSLTTFGQAVDTGRKVWEKGKLGKNAIVDMSKVIKALSTFELPFKQARAFPGRRPVFTFPTKIEGGTFIDVVPDRCVAYGDVRLMPGNTDVQAKIWIQERLAESPEVKWEMEDLLYVPSVEIDRNEPIVQILAEQTRKVLGKSAKIEGCGPWNDSWMLVNRDIPCIAGFGPDGGEEEKEGEWVDLKSLQEVTKVYARSIVELLGVVGQE